MSGETTDQEESETQLEFEDSVEIPTTKADAWAFISDPENLVDCVPGAEDVQRHSQDEYIFEIVQTIGPFSVTLDGEVELVEMNEPDWIVADGHAYDGATGSHFDVLAAMEMEDAGKTVDLAYRADLSMTGGVASVGARIARRVVRSNVETYFENIKSQFDAEAAD